MERFKAHLRRAVTSLVLLAGAVLIASHPAAAAPYVDRTLGDLPPEQRVRVAEPAPVQLLYTFQTNGEPNGRAANHTRARIAEAVRASGLFASVSNEPVPGGAVLSITLNNVFDRGAATRRGIRTGLTFGLAGTTVTDHYEVTFEFLPREQSATFRSSVSHAIHTTIGRERAPENGIRARNLNEAIGTVIRQSVAHGLNRLALEQAFPGTLPAGRPDAAPEGSAAPAGGTSPSPSPAAGPTTPR